MVADALGRLGGVADPAGRRRPAARRRRLPHDAAGRRRRRGPLRAAPPPQPRPGGGARLPRGAPAGGRGAGRGPLPAGGRGDGAGRRPHRRAHGGGRRAAPTRLAAEARVSTTSSCPRACGWSPGPSWRRASGRGCTRRWPACACGSRPARSSRPGPRRPRRWWPPWPTAAGEVADGARLADLYGGVGLFAATVGRGATRRAGRGVGVVRGRRPGEPARIATPGSCAATWPAGGPAASTWSWPTRRGRASAGAACGPWRATRAPPPGAGELRRRRARARRRPAGAAPATAWWPRPWSTPSRTRRTSRWCPASISAERPTTAIDRSRKPQRSSSRVSPCGRSRR